MTDKRDVSGVWYGSFSGRHVVANRFIATLEERGGQIVGTITEPDERGNTDILRADVSGGRSGPQVDFLKQYDGSAHAGHAIDYSGQIDIEGTEISGEWCFARYSGPFVMQREQFGEELLAEEEGVALDVEIVAR